MSPFAAIDRDRHGQLVSGPEVGDCFRACMSVLLGVPNGDHLPTLTLANANGDWWIEWWKFLWNMGLELSHGNPKGPIWRAGMWIASVPSKNFDGKSHAIVMHDTDQVLFDPSPKRRYHAGHRLSGRDLIIDGTHVGVADARYLHHLVALQAHFNSLEILR